MKNCTAFQLVLAVASLLAALPAAKAAPTDAPAPPPAAAMRGQVTAVDAAAKTITVQDRRRQTTTVLHVTDATHYLVDTAGAIADLKIGQTVRVLGQTTDTTVTARMIQIVPSEEVGQPAPQGGRPGGYAPTQGVIATLTPTLTITTDDKKTDTVQTDATTRVTTSHAGTLADVKLQDNVNVLTTGTGDAAVATSVHVRLAGGYGGGRPGGGGGPAPAR